MFFFEPKTIRNIFLKRKPLYNENEIQVSGYKRYLIPLIVIYFTIQIALPFRHWFIKGDVLFTEEGHRLSWRMMLRSKHGNQTFTVVDKETKEKKIIDLNHYLTKKQISAVSSKPDMIWQFAQRLKKEGAKKNKDVAVYVRGKISVNGRPYQPFINDSIDLASIKWNHFNHSSWILPFNSSTTKR